jgi:FliI/YscN family ATPase
MTNPSKVYKSPEWAEHDVSLSLEAECLAVPTPLDGGESAATESVGAGEGEAERLRQMLEQAGYERGYQDGRCQAAAEYTPELARQQQLLQTMQEQFNAYLDSVEPFLQKIILRLLEKLTGQQSELHAALVRENIKRALAITQEPGEMLTLHLHPKDYQRFAPADQEGIKNLRLVPDKRITPGGCLLEGRYGSLDARWETQMEEVEKALTGHTDLRRPLEEIEEAITAAAMVRSEGRVENIVGTVIESRGPAVAVGEQCDIITNDQGASIRAEVIGFKQENALLMPLGEKQGIGPGNRVVARGWQFTVKVGKQMLGRVLNGLGEPLDGLGPWQEEARISIHGQPNNPMERRTIREPLYTGIRAIDGLLTCGKGGRMGIFAGSGVGKSVLLGMMGRNTAADVNVIALIGERGREVKEFIERDLGPEGLARSVVVAVTSDESPVVRIHGASLAASVAEYFARLGKDVLFMMDSVTRFAMAHREIGLAIGEPPTTKGYTPSTFAALPKLLERSGLFQAHGSITGFYTVLVEGDDMDEPVADHVRSILDGHVVLSRSLFAQNHFPAIDVLNSISRLSKEVLEPRRRALPGMIRDQIATVREAQDLINIGAYVRGSNPKIDQALSVIGQIEAFLKQDLSEHTAPESVWSDLERIGGLLGKRGAA